MHNLFRPPSPAVSHDIALALKAVEAVLPLSAAHSRDVPHAVRDLSRLLTAERSQLDQPYWTSPRFESAYCRYFLPWNLHRLAWLLPAMGLALTAGDRVLDLGSGPLTMPLALWISYPQWRHLPLHFTCVDVAPHPLHLGQDIFTRLAGKDSPWRFTLLRAPIETALRTYREKAALITAANVINEIPPPRNAPLESRLEQLTELMGSRLQPGGSICIVEPGTRLGGKLVALTRRAAQRCGLSASSPCPHGGPCPMLSGTSSGWCHFSVLTTGAPQALTSLSRRAKLEKRSLSLSCLLLRHHDLSEGMHANPADPASPFAPPDSLEAREYDPYGGEADDLDGYAGDDAFSDDAVWEDEPERAPRGSGPRVGPRPESGQSFVRIISDPIELPGQEESARYACSERGMCLILNAGRMPSGAALTIRWPEEDSFDPKTGFLMASLQKSATAKHYDPKKRPARSAHDAAPEGDPEQRRSRPHGRKRGPEPDRDGSRPRGAHPDRPDRPDKPGRPARPDRRNDTDTQNERSERGGMDAPQRRDRPARPDKPTRPGRATVPTEKDGPTRTGRTGRTGGRKYSPDAPKTPRSKKARG